MQSFWQTKVTVHLSMNGCCVVVYILSCIRICSSRSRSRTFDHMNAFRLHTRQSLQ